MMPNVQNTTNLAPVLKIWVGGATEAAGKAEVVLKALIFPGFQGGNADFDFGNFNDIFSDFFQAEWEGVGRKREKGRDISTEIQISFSESILGTSRKVYITKNSKCATCGGSGAKPGTKMETCKYCNGQGKIREVKRTIFGNISSTKICEECLGAGEVPKEKCEICKGKGIFRREEEVSINIPSAIQNGQTLKMTGYGEAVKNGKVGDLYIKINVKIPSKISKRARELLESSKKRGYKNEFRNKKLSKL